MTPPGHAVLGCMFAQIAQRGQTYVSKTDQTAQSDQRTEKAREFRALFGPELTSSLSELTSGTAQQTNSGLRCADPPSGRAHQAAAARPAR